MDGDARIGGFLAHGYHGQQGDALAVGDEFDAGRQRSGRESAPGGIGAEAAGGDGLVAMRGPNLQASRPILFPAKRVARPTLRNNPHRISSARRHYSPGAL
jgi:hypothetical protein